MKLIADLHTHTVASTHAFSTVGEMINRAREIGLCAMAVTDHGTGLKDSPHKYYFSNLHELPSRPYDDFLLLRGVEANVMDTGGALDMSEEVLQTLDWVVVSLHRSVVDPMSLDEATAMWLKVADNPHVDLIGHSEQDIFRYDYDHVTKVFAQKNKVVEINANSQSSRPGNEGNQRELALACKRNGTKIAVDSDAHVTFSLGNYENVLPMLREIDFPEELIINSSRQRLVEELQLHGKPIAQTASFLLKQ